MRALPSLRQLGYLAALAEHRHFGRAAQACCVTQSTLSAGVRELEATLGVVLVERNQRRFALTQIGEVVVERAHDLLAAAEDLASAASSAGEPLSGTLRLGVIPTIAPYLLPGVLARVRPDHPALRLYLREDRTARLLDMLRASRLDAALIALPWDVARLTVEVLGRDRLMLACRRDHRLAKASAVDVADLAGEPVLLLEDGHCLRDHVLTSCRLAPGRDNEDLQGGSLGTLLQMAASGLGLTFLPEMAAPLETGREPSIVAVPLADEGAVRDVALVWRPGAPLRRDLGLLARYFGDDLARLRAESLDRAAADGARKPVG